MNLVVINKWLIPAAQTRRNETPIILVQRTRLKAALHLNDERSTVDVCGV